MKQRTRADWLSLFESHAQSGLTASAFCKQHGLCPRYFSVRKKQLLKSHPPLIKVQKQAAPAIEAGSVRLHLGAVQISLHGASPDYVASLLQKLRQT